MLPGIPRTARSLHQPGSHHFIHVPRGSDTDVAAGLLHDDAEDDALVDADLGALEDGVPDRADILAGVASLEHFGLVEVEDFFKRLPLAHGGGSWRLGLGTR